MHGLDRLEAGCLCVAPPDRGQVRHAAHPLRASEQVVCVYWVSLEELS